MTDKKKKETEKEEGVTLNEAIDALNKRFSTKNSTYISTEKTNKYDCVRTSSGSYSVDVAVGGGLPRSKVITIAGEYSSGKTTLALLTAASFQRTSKKKVVFIDTDGGYDPHWAKTLGVNTDPKQFIIIQSDYIEQVSDTMETLLAAQDMGLVIFDSVANTPTKAELETSCEKDSYGGIGKPMAQMMRKITKKLRHTDASVIVINQLRDKVGVCFGMTEYMPGGRALKFQSDVILWLRPAAWIKDVNEERIGRTTAFKVTKNRTAPPFKTGEFDLYFEGYIDNNSALVKHALAEGVVTKKGSWYMYEEQKSQGMEKFVEAIVENKLLAKLKKDVEEAKQQ